LYFNGVTNLLPKKLLILFFLLILFIPLEASAQNLQSLSVVEVDLWPEYDRPSMLVIYHLVLPPDVKYPLDMEIRMPTAAGVPNAVAARQPDGSLINLNYEQTPGVDWSRVKFTATTPEVQFEYYNPSLVKDNDARHFEYRWPGDYAVQDFRIEVQQPAGASHMRISPSLGSGITKSDGLVYYSSEIGSLPLGQSLAINIDYQKQSDELSAQTIPIDPSGPIKETSVNRLTIMSALPWLIGGLGLLLIAGGAIWYWQSGREQPIVKPKERQRKPSARIEGTVEEEGYVYCHQCGKRALSGDRFCRACGSQLRTGK